MLEFVHATAGGFIAYKINQPLLALPMALASHFVLDLLPHWNPSLSKEKKNKNQISLKTKIIILIDCLFGLYLGLNIASRALPDVNKAVLVVFGCLAGIMPDLIEAPYYFFNKKIPQIKGLIEFQNNHQWNVSPFFGLLFQVLILFILFSFL